MIKALKKLRIEGAHINTIKDAYDKLRSSKENFKAFHLKPRMRQGNPFSLFLFNMVLEVLARAARQEKKIKGIQRGKEEVTVSLFANDMII